MGAIIISDTRHVVQTVAKSPFEVQMTLSIRDFQKQDIGSYSCTAKNSLGEMESNIRLYEIAGPTKAQNAIHPGPYGENQSEEEDNITLYRATDVTKMRSNPLDNKVYWYIGQATASLPSPTVKANKNHISIVKISPSVGLKLQSGTSVINMLFIVFYYFKW
ncbi:uncharacterized protein LOC117168932 [Belonocnema kinseyi]|uniref:uncharacterized protein LOC117168932 n=1 Tax=Belonocnema kinseyi TaxID=2817044 RepID=UPI00143CDD75|nr:uncharacterized protein LOC117168932 [Belonocnema kinseyi]